MIRSLPLLALLASASVGCAAEQDWLNHERWDEGLAEVCLYTGKQLKYGTLRDSRLEVITVREHFDPERLVKTRPAPGKAVIRILKQNVVRETRTGVYEYNQMASVFLDRDTGETVKLSAVSMEWCGNSHVLFEAAHGDEPAALTIANYMDDRGTTRTTLEPNAVPLFDEALIPYLRQNLDRINKGDTLPTARPLADNNPVFRRAPRTVKAVRRTQETVDIVLEGQGATETFTFANSALRRLKKWRNDRGEEYTLQKVLFLDYWNRNRPGDAKLLPEAFQD